MLSWLDRLFQNSATLPDHNIADLKQSATSTAWSHIHACPLCKSPIGHQEYMTDICLSCGSTMPPGKKSAATRKIVRDGRWVKTVRINNVEYMHDDSNWVPIK